MGENGTSRELVAALTPEQRGAAALEAGGASVKEIADAMAVQQGTVRKWRDNPLYSVAVDEIGRNAVSDLEPIIKRVRATLLDGISEAVKTLIENLGAVDEDHQPLYSVRQAAAATLMSHADLVVGLKQPKQKAGDGGEQKVGPSASVTVVIPESLAKDGSPFHVQQQEPDKLEADDPDDEVVDAETVE